MFNLVNHPVKITSFDDVWYALFILGCVSTGIATITTLVIIWRFCSRSFGVNTRRVGFSEYPGPGILKENSADENLTNILERDENTCILVMYRISKFFGYLISLPYILF